LPAPHRKNRKRPGRNDGRRMRRYKVERTFGWLHSYRRLLVHHIRRLKPPPTVESP
jgi:transposase